MIAYIAWAAEFCLETSGAILAYRKRLRILSALLAWRALADIITFCLWWHEDAYRYTTWGARAVQYAILYALGMQIAAKMVADYRPMTQYVYRLIAIAGSLTAYAFAITDAWAQKFAAADAVTSFMLLAVVLVGWIARKKRLEEPWRMITLGLCISGVGSAGCAILTDIPSVGWKLYPIPAILSLLLWNYSVLPRKRLKLVAYRGNPNQERKPVRSEQFPRMQSRFVN